MRQQAAKFRADWSNRFVDIRGPLEGLQKMVIGPLPAIELHESQSLIESNVNG